MPGSLKTGVRWPTCHPAHAAEPAHAWCSTGSSARAGGIRLSALRVDDSGECAKDIRAHLLKHKIRPSRTYRAVYDTWGKKGQQTRVHSLRPSNAHVQTQGANNAARKTGAVPKPKPPAAKPAATPSTGRRATRTPRLTPP